MEVYAVKHKDALVRSQSRSGGVFTAISDLFLGCGCVYGVVLNGSFDAIHIRAEEKCERDKMRGSKYIQSQLGNCFKEVKRDLDIKKRVLFSGTSCQIAGLKQYLQQDYPNLFCVDIVCHGVPSNKVWHRYLEWISCGRCISSVDFRNKSDFGWASHVESVVVEGEKVNSEVFKNIFYGHYALRPSCYDCPFKSVNHPGDITIADYWGIEEAAPEFDDNKGVSLVLINSTKGKQLFEDAKKDLIYVETEIEKSMQHPFVEPEKKPVSRDQFWKDFQSKSFNFIARRYGGNTLIFQIKQIVKKMLRKPHSKITLFNVF